MKLTSLCVPITLLLSIFPVLPGSAQDTQPTMAEVNAMTLTVDMQNEIIGWICDKLELSYIDAETASGMNNYLHTQAKSGAYKDQKTLSSFRKALTHDLQSVSKDLHIRINPVIDPPKDEIIPKEIIGDRKNNYEFKEIKRLDGNIGYLRLDSFRDPRYAAPTAIAAMNFLANCDALIIDLRWNGGGYGELVQLMISYFFAEPVHYLNTWKRDGDITRQYWTYATVQGPVMASTDLYVLTSNDYTFSAAEEFAFDLKNQHRATIIGETTSGGGHGITFFYFPKYYLSLRVPNSRSYDPKTNTGWEGVGIEPDIKTDSDTAFDTAYIMALDSLRMEAEGSTRAALTWQWEYHKALLDAIIPASDVLANVAGSYGPVKVTTREDGCYIKEPGSKQFKRLHFLSDTRFIIEDNLKIRGEFLRNEEGAVTGMKALLENGETRTMPRAR
ncbi:S41 family peptidase [bacterium]|nr:S41 family peptidase [bacterium]